MEFKQLYSFILSKHQVHPNHLIQIYNDVRGCNSTPAIFFCELASIALVAMKKAIHDATAQICKDTAEPPHDLELIEPQPLRRWARLVVIAAVGVFLAAAIVVLAVRIPELQTDKKTVSSKEELETLLSKAVEENQTITCPCKDQVMSWCQITTFHIYIAADKQGRAIKSILNYTMDQAEVQLEYDICASPDFHMAEIICMHILSPVMNLADSRTYLPTANVFTRPELLYMEMATRIDTNAFEKSSAFTFLIDNNTKLYNYSQGLIELVRNMAYQFNISSSSSALDYWKQSAETRAEYHLSFAFGMDVNWEKYLKDCNAGFCDVEFRVSILNRVLRAMGQVGGITTVLSLTLKFLIWPALRMALRFPTSKQRAAIPT